MNIALVTSQITYVPDNYLSLMRDIVSSNKKDIRLVIFIANGRFALLRKSISLYLIGARRFAKALLKNITESVNDPRIKLLKSYDIEYMIVDNINSPEVIQKLKHLQIDLVINARTRSIYKKKLLKTPTLGCINIHHGELPDNRGTFCDLHAIVQNKMPGFSIHVMESKIDAGSILRRKTLPIKKDYLNYIQESSLQEAKELCELIKEIKQLKALPKGIENNSQSIHYYKNPNRKQINNMIKQGIIL